MRQRGQCDENNWIRRPRVAQLVRAWTVARRCARSQAFYIDQGAMPARANDKQAAKQGWEMLCISVRRLAQGAALMLAAWLVACGGDGDGEGEGDSGAGRSGLELYIDTPAADGTLDTAVASLFGGASCPDCPPSQSGCPSTVPFIPSTAVSVSWANRLTGDSGTALSGISGQCSCLFSVCVYSYSRRWSALSVPVAFGANAIAVTATDNQGRSGTATRTLTRVPTAPQGVSAAAGKGQVTVSWNGVQSATSYNVYWSTSRTFTKETGTKITNVSSPYALTGLANEVTYYFLITAEVNGLEGAGSSVAWATVGWATEPVGDTTLTTLERDVAIAVDAAGNPLLHFSYDEEIGTASLQYNVLATKTAGAWSASPVARTSAVNAAIALDAGGTVHVSYLDFGGLVHAVLASGAWNAEVVDAGASCGAALALNAAGKVHVAYRAVGPSGGELRYATNATGSWVTGTITTFSTLGCSVPKGIAITVDRAGGLHIAFAGEYPEYGLKYATRQGGSWSIVTLDEAHIRQLSAAADASGRVHIAYADNVGRLRYATNGSGPWSVSDIEALGSPAFPAIALDGIGNPHVSYFYPGYGELRYAKNAAGTWQISVVADAGAANSGSDTAIAIDGLGNAHIGYFDNRSGSLRYATSGGG